LISAALGSDVRLRIVLSVSHARAIILCSKGSEVLMSHL
jgi:hypothetical protein